MFEFLKRQPEQIDGYDWNKIDPALWSKFSSLAARCHVDIHFAVASYGLPYFLRCGIIAIDGMFDIRWLSKSELGRVMYTDPYASVLFGELMIIKRLKKENPNFLSIDKFYWNTINANDIISDWSSECAARILFRKDDLREKINGKSIGEINAYLDRLAS